MHAIYEELSSASSVEEIVSLTRDFLARCSREELERLPATCRPRGVNGVADIERWADQLFAESRRAALVHEDERCLDRLTSHFLIASVRIRQLATAEA